MNIPLEQPENPDIYSFGFDKSLNRGGPIKSSVVYDVNATVEPVLLGGSGVIISDLTLGSGNIKSGNYVAGLGGWKLTANGDLEASTGTFRGTITATTGSIGGWSISAAAIYKDGATDALSAGLAPADYPFYAGKKYADRATAPFRITPAGALFGSSVEVTGKITAGTGSSIASDYLSGIIAQANLNVSNRGWVQTCVLSLNVTTPATQVDWAAGTFTSADGTAYSIVAGNTGVMAAKTYIYLDTAVSVTAYQKTTTVTTAVGAGKVLIAIAQNGTGEATYFVFNGQGGLNINGVDIVAGSVSATELADLAVSTAKVAANAITTAKIAADAVTAAEIATSAVGSSELAAGSVIAGKIAALTIVAADIAAGTITGAKIAAITIEAANIAAGAITTAKIAALAVTAAEIAAETITAAKITAGTITTTQIAAATILAGNIVAGTITGNEIAASTIEAGKLSVAQLSAISADIGDITAGTITGLLFQTAASGERIEISSSGKALSLINASGSTVMKLFYGTLSEDPIQFINTINQSRIGLKIVVDAAITGANPGILIDCNANDTGVFGLDIDRDGSNASTLFGATISAANAGAGSAIALDLNAPTALRITNASVKGIDIGTTANGITITQTGSSASHSLFIDNDSSNINSWGLFVDRDINLDGTAYGAIITCHNATGSSVGLDVNVGGGTSTVNRGIRIAGSPQHGIQLTGVGEVFEVDADTTALGTYAGRIPIDVAGVKKYLAYYNA